MTSYGQVRIVRCSHSNCLAGEVVSNDVSAPLHFFGGCGGFTVFVVILLVERLAIY
jgi:hypothetical protein